MRVAEFLLGSIPFLVQLYTEQYRQIDLKKTLVELEYENNVPITKVYDFIIVGGGSAGCVVAGRLSEKFNVLLLEAGGEPPPATNVPYFTAAVGHDPNLNYFFKSVPKNNNSVNNGVLINHTGKMLGGSGSHNDMGHNRGNPKDYDNWANITEDPTFSYANLLKYFKKNENFVGRTFSNDSGGKLLLFHNFSKRDSWHKNINSSVAAILQCFIENVFTRELGFEIIDPNGFQREGFAPLNIAVRNGTRSSSYLEYIKPFEENRVNLTVIRYANVSEILLDGNRKAYGVAYTRHGFPQIARASKEIILSAGTFSSPLLLMKSGIGPEAALQAAGIPVKVPIEAVGKNLAEHPSVILSSFTVNDSSLFVKINPEEVEQLSDQYHNGEGPLAIIGVGPQCFLASSKGESDWPDLSVEIAPVITTDGEEPTAKFFVVLGRPKSRGELKMHTEKYKAGVRDDVQLALIDFNMLSHPDDVEALLEGVKFAFRIVEETRAFQRINMTYTERPDEVCSAYPFRSDDYWRCFIRKNAESWIHMVATNRMASDNDTSATSVVDTKFRVRGVSNLRIVDGSVFPSMTNANINAPIMMLAEKAADEILHVWN